MYPRSVQFWKCPFSLYKWCFHSVEITIILYSIFFLMQSSALRSCRLFDDGHSDPCKIALHCSFDLHFFNNWHWAAFCVPVGHLCVFFEEMSKSFYWVVFDFEFSELSAYFENEALDQSHCLWIFSPSP